MDERRFPNRDDLIALREKGVVAVSPYVCRMVATLCLLSYLSQSELLNLSEQLLQANLALSPTYFTEFHAIIGITVKAIIIYLAAFAFTALLQSRFYFRLSHVFHRSEAFIDIKRIFSFLKISVLLALCGTLLLYAIAVLLGVRAFAGLIALIESDGAAVIQQKLLSSLWGLNLNFSIIMGASVVLALISSKVGFLIKQRIKNSRG